jgi:TPR repeat protein
MVAVKPINSHFFALGLSALLVAGCNQTNQKNFEDLSVAELKAVAAKGDSQAQFALAFRYFHGRGVSKNPREAMEWFRQAAELGFPSAQTILGEAYLKGFVVEKNQRAAVSWFQKAAAKGEPPAQLRLAICYLNGTGTETNLTEGVVWLRRAAEKDLANAQVELGRCYVFGRGTEQSFTKSAELFSKAANQNYPEGQYWFALQLISGHGVDKNLAEAWKWIILAKGKDPVLRELVSEQMKHERITPEQIVEGERLASEFARTNQTAPFFVEGVHAL